MFLLLFILNVIYFLFFIFCFVVVVVVGVLCVCVCVCVCLVVWIFVCFCSFYLAGRVVVVMVVDFCIFVYECGFVF